jgi:oxidase EvaA
MHKTPWINQKEDLLNFKAKIYQLSNFQLSQIPFLDQKDWTFDNMSLSHYSGGFFHVTGLENKETREERLILYQPQSALTGLAMYKDGLNIFILLQARVEPGNSGVVQFGPTIQSTSANYNRQHGGKATSCLKWFDCIDSNILPLGHSIQLDIGKRYYLKNKMHQYVELRKPIDVESVSMAWVSLKTIHNCLSIDNLFNTDLRSLLSLFDWENYLTGFTPNINKCSNLFRSNFGHTNWQLKPLTELKKWHTDETDIFSSENSLSVKMYRISCTTREMNEWSQPLIYSPKDGLVVLFTSVIEGKTCYLLTLDKEFGTTGEYLILPSLLCYPEEGYNLDKIKLKGQVIKETVQSEEGGRFYKNENKYFHIEVTSNFNVKENQYWISGEELRVILKTSNKVSIQLRCACSLVLDKLYPSILEIGL